MMRTMAGLACVLAAGCATTRPAVVSGTASPTHVAHDGVGSVVSTGTDTDAAFALGWAHATSHGDEMRAQQCRVRGCDEPPVLDLIGAAQQRLLASKPDERRLLDAYARGVQAADPSMGWEPSDSMALTLRRGLRHSTGLRTELAALQAQELGTFDLDDALRDEGLPTEAAWDELRGALPYPSALPDWLTTHPGASSGVAIAARRTGGAAPLLGTVLGRRGEEPPLVAVSIQTPEWAVDGLTEPGIPAFWAGRNETLAWTLVPAYADALDLVVVGLQGDRYTLHGEERVLTDGGLTDIGPVVARADAVGLVLRTTATDPGDETLLTLWRMAHSPDVVTAVRAFDRPTDTAWRLITADVEGRVADAMVGRVVRRRQVTGRVPHDGRDVDRWQGRVDRLPRLLDPPMGVVASTGARPPGPVSAAVGTDFADADRADRLVSALAWQQSVSADGMWQVLTDTTVDVSAAHELLQRMSPNTAEGRVCGEQLMAWDGDVHDPVAAIWRAWRRASTDVTLSTWSDPAARAWRTWSHADAEPPGAPWMARSDAERIASLDAACAVQLDDEPGSVGTLFPTAPGQAAAGGLVIPLDDVGIQVWTSKGVRPFGQAGSASR